MIGEEQFQTLPKTAFVLNPARGPINHLPSRPESPTCSFRM